MPERVILVVDDEPMSHQLISAGLRVLDEIRVRSAYSAAEALDIARSEPPDLIISDISMPEMDGFGLCKALRADERLGMVPIMLLTARGQAHDKYEGFLQGADDYLVKPVDIMELQLRIKALLRRVGGAALPVNGPLKAGAMVLHEARLGVAIGANEVRLTASEFAILKFLTLNAERLVSAESLLQNALNYPPKVGSPQTIHTHVNNLRNKFRQAGLDVGFLSSSKQGYLFTPPEEGTKDA